jgi:general secretion pathway protein K
MGMEPTIVGKGEQDRERGFIVVAVLWILATLSALVMIYLVYVTDTAVIVAGTSDRIQREALVSAAVELAAYRLTAVSETDRPSHGAFDTRVGSARVSVGFRSEDARVDLNAAPKALLASFIKGLGAAPSDADSYADHIIAWRSPLKTGASDPENAFYATVGASYLPRHAAFPGTEELWLVQGIPSPLIDGMLPFVTVFSNLESINVMDAAPEVLAALPGLTPDRLQAVLNQRDSPDVDPNTIAQLAGVMGAAPRASPAYRLDVVVEASGGRRDGAEVVILLLDNGDEPYRVLSWRSGLDNESEPQKIAPR